VKVDVAFVGGGLANSLSAYRLHSARPHLDVLVVERGPSLGAGHTWSFHDSDLEAAQRQWLQPLVAHSWPFHELRFPRLRRVMTGGYNTVSSDSLHREVSQALPDGVLLRSEVTEVTPESVRLADGSLIEARSVIDGRGDPGSQHIEIAYQKFVGAFVTLAGPHHLQGPILMDATVEQLDGYRFIYVLPFSPTDLLIEDTYYSDDHDLDHETILDGISAYADDRGWSIAAITGEEHGVLPIVLGGDIEAFWGDGPAGVPRSGMRAALFHPTTGYSLPEAVRLADALCRLDECDSAAVYDLTRRRSLTLWRHNGFFRLLNRMLFRAAEPAQRYRVFERFYGLSENLIHRFYSGRLGWIDKIRLLTGKPPVPVGRALRCLRG
jgi:lycopene beta-cyclase